MTSHSTIHGHNVLRIVPHFRNKIALPNISHMTSVTNESRKIDKWQEHWLFQERRC